MKQLGGIVVVSLLLGAFCPVQANTGFGTAFSMPSVSAPAILKPEKTHHVFQIKHREVDFLQQQLAALFPNVSCVADQSNGQLHCVGPKSLSGVKAYLDQADQPRPQVNFEVQILETSSEHTKHYKQLFSDLTDGFKFSLSLPDAQLKPDPTAFPVFLSTLLSEGKAKLLAKPNVLTLDQEEAVVRVGERVPYVTSFVRNERTFQEVRHLDVGVEIRIRAKVLENNLIQTEIYSQVSEIKLWREVGDGIYPILSSRETTTKVQLKNNQTLIIAGLLEDQQKTSESKVPILWRLPILGQLFKHQYKEKQQTEIIFTLKPKTT